MRVEVAGRRRLDPDRPALATACDRRETSSEAVRDEAVVRRGPPGGHERLRPAAEDEHAGVDRRWRGERAPRQPPGDADLVGGAPEDAVDAARPGDACLWATAHSTTRSAWTSGVAASSSSAWRIPVVRAKGRFATTLNGTRGRVTAVPSPQTTSTFGQRPRRASASLGSSSIATTRRAARESSAVSRPVPAPTSRTRSDPTMPADATSSAASVADRRKCWLRGGDGRARDARRPATEERGRGAHRPDASGRVRAVARTLPTERSRRRRR